MRQRRVAVALLSPFKASLLACGLLLALCSLADDRFTVDHSLLDISPSPTGYLARIASDSPEEIAAALARAEELYKLGNFESSPKPIVIVLHGPEIEVFFKDKYQEYKEIVDLAARLSAFGIVDVRVCETETGVLGRSPSNLHSFIGTVPFGPSEIRRLLNKGHVSF